MNQYELLYIVPAKLEEDARKAVVERVSKVITDNQGIIKDHNSWLTRKLSYPINHIRQGVFMLAHFTIPGDNITKIKREFEIDEDILRVSVVQVDERKKTTAAPRRTEKVLPQSVRENTSEAPNTTKAIPTTVVAETNTSETEEKVSLEELDKKLEELLSSDSEVK